MKTAFALVMSLGLAISTGCQREATLHEYTEAANPIKLTNRVLEASCGECQFGMNGDDCDLAIRIDGKAYFVDGSTIDQHGDAHADDGLCNSIRHARVSGEVIDGRFVASTFELLAREE